MDLSYFSSLFCVDCQGKFSICISNDNSIFSFGYCICGDNGLGLGFSNVIPKQIPNLTNIKMISCGYNHTACITYENIMYLFGNNEEGQLGIGKDKNELEFTHIPQKINLPPIIQVSCGLGYTICISEDGYLFSFGYNGDGELGIGTNQNEISPKQIPELNNINLVECGGAHIICKTYNNEYYSWGNNRDGQLGQGNNKSCNKPIQCLNWPDNIIDIKCGLHKSLLLTLEGDIYSFGYNANGQLGLNDENIESVNIPTLIKDIPEIQRIECGYNHSICIDINDNLWIFGDNYYGQLGLGDTENIYKPIIHPTLSNIIDISSKGNHTFVKTIDNKIYAFGYNEYSQLGIKTKEKHQLTPIQVLKNNEDIWCSTIGKSKQKSARK